MVERALIMVVVALALLVGAMQLGKAVRNTFCGAAGALGGQVLCSVDDR